MGGTISIDPDPAERGKGITITCTDGSPGTWALTLSDEDGTTFAVQVSLNAQGNGTTSASIPSTWGAWLTIEGEPGSGLDDYNGAVT